MIRAVTLAVVAAVCGNMVAALVAAPPTADGAAAAGRDSTADNNIAIRGARMLGGLAGEVPARCAARARSCMAGKSRAPSAQRFPCLVGATVSSNLAAACL